jgi:uroporphyrinogen decarboxylase
MTDKENALRIIRFQEPERVMPDLPKHVIEYNGMNHEGEDRLGHDSPVGSKWIDFWGTEWHKEHEGVMGFPCGNPLSEIKYLKHYQWPDPDDERRCKKIYEMAGEHKKDDDLFLAGGHRDTLWEKAYMLVGMENLMVYFLTEPGFVKEILHRVMDFQLGIAEHYVKADIEVAGLGDDLGTQKGPLLGPDIVDEFLVPEYRRLFDFYKKNKVIIEFHSCGCVESVLETLMSLSVDVLNPVQATANDLKKVRQVTRKSMALKGGVSSGLIMSGPREAIMDQVRQRIHELGSEGGYFCGPDQWMPYPEENIETVYKAVEEFGLYPLAENQKKVA